MAGTVISNTKSCHVSKVVGKTSVAFWMPIKAAMLRCTFQSFVTIDLNGVTLFIWQEQ
jgi:hypothetical protein